MKESEIINFVIKEEEKEGRRAKDVSKDKKGYDIESIDKKGNKRFIEVKRRDFPKRRFVDLTQSEFMNFVRNPAMWLYVVYKDKSEKWKIIKLDREKVLKGIKPRIISKFEVSLRKEITGV